MKRFYTLVSARKQDRGYVIMLDDRAVNTPAKNKLCCAHKALANELVKEWAVQEEIIKPDTMPLTQIVTTRLDQVAQQRAAMTEAILKYLDTDLICYRTDQPPELAQRQAEHWDKWLHWFADEFGAQLEITTAIQALKQPEKAHQAVRECIEALDDDRFTVAQMIIPLSGSLVLALAFARQTISSEDLFKAIRVEEQFQAEIYNEEQYGPDPAQDQKDAAVKVDLDAAERFLQLIG